MQKNSTLKIKILFFVLGFITALITGYFFLIFQFESIPSRTGLIGDDIIDTECEEWLIKARITSYNNGYMTCLDDVAPNVYKAYHQTKIDLSRNMIYNDSLLANYLTKYDFNEYENRVLTNLLQYSND